MWRRTPRHRRRLPPSSSCKAVGRGKPLHALNMRWWWQSKRLLLGKSLPKRHLRQRTMGTPRAGLAMVVMACPHT
jgi:hypothetical protein